MIHRRLLSFGLFHAQVSTAGNSRSTPAISNTDSTAGLRSVSGRRDDADVVDLPEVELHQVRGDLDIHTFLLRSSRRPVRGITKGPLRDDYPEGLPGCNL